MAAAQVTVWNEHVSERREQVAARAYPLGLHATIAEGIGAVMRGCWPCRKRETCRSTSIRLCPPCRG